MLHGVYQLINSKVNNSTDEFWVLPWDFSASRRLICCYTMLYYVLSAATVCSDELYWYVLPYSGKVWRGESLANLANRP